MATYEEIIQKLDTALNDPQSRQTWHKSRNEKNELVVDQGKLDTAKQELRELYNEADPTVYNEKAFQLMEKYKGAPVMGSAICQAMLAKGDPGKIGMTDVCKRVMREEAGRYVPGGDGFIRGQHAITGATMQFIEDTSPGYQQSITQRIDAMAERYQTNGLLDKTAQGKDWGAKTEITSQLGTEMVAIMSSAPLSQDSVSFLREMRESVKSDDRLAPKLKEHMKKKNPGVTDEEVELAKLEMADSAVNNSTALRYVGPSLQKNAKCQNNPLWKDASSAALSTFSGARQDTVKPKTKGGGTSQSEEDIATNKHLAEISKNIHESRGMVTELLDQVESNRTGVMLASKHLHEAQFDTANLDRAAKLATANVQVVSAKLEPLQKKADDLNKFMSMEKLKAIFSRKGLAATRKETGEQITNVKEEVRQANIQVDRIKETKDNMPHLREKMAFAQRTGLNPDSLNDALKVPAVSKALMKFAEKEHNLENFEFMQAVDQLKKDVANGVPLDKLQESVAAIKSTYLEAPDGDVGSLDVVDKSINLSGAVRNPMEATLDDIAKEKPEGVGQEEWEQQQRQKIDTVLDGARQEVFDMVGLDTMKRFRESPQFKEAVTEANKPPVPSTRESAGIKPLSQSQSLKQSTGTKLVGTF